MLKNKYFWNDSKNYFWIATMFFSILLFSIPLMVTLPRQFGLIFRYEFSSLIVLLLLIFIPIYLANKNLGIFLRISLTLFVFALPLSGLWNSGNSEPGIVGGLLPYSDDLHYLNDALRLLNGFDFSSLATRRPLFTILFSGILWIFNQNLQITLAVLVIINAIGLILSTNELLQYEGKFATIFFAVLFFLYYRRFIGIPVTEHLGLVFGVLGFTFILRGSKLDRPIFAHFGILCFSLAVNARAGTMFLLPALVLWVGFHFRGKGLFSWKNGIWALSFAAAGFLINYFMFTLLAADNTSLFSNFSYTFYGLANGGKSWTAVFTEHPEISGLKPAEQSALIYHYAIDTIYHNPSLLIKGMLTAWQRFLDIRLNVGMFGFVSGGDIYIFAENLSGNAYLYLLGRVIIGLLALIGIVEIIAKRKSERWLLIAVWAGILLSVPFVPPWDADRMRVYAASIPWLIYYPAVGLQTLLKWIKFPFTRPCNDYGFSNSALNIFTFGLIFFIVLFPVLIKVIGPFQTASKEICESGNKALDVNISKGSYLIIVPDEEGYSTKIPDVELNRFVRSVHDLENYPLTLFFEQIQPNQMITISLDKNTGNSYWLLMDVSEGVPKLGRYIACGDFIGTKQLPISPYRVQKLQKYPNQISRWCSVCPLIDYFLIIKSL